ncbi:Co-chaperone Hsc20 [Plenodomus tracheiphilus IPT5]|uniref:Co-chaperone Hsc20 n=1 Tax=Plenodomus tracheiphilus IPT5 TaxID=1408161 RepID=A0A6A7AWC8_9PLEO|nr:Co-chaperone Hsc20 [Plenodomus tracheiphilus IPT5]
MRAIRSQTTRRIRAALISESTTSQSRTPQRVAPCLLCSHRASPPHPVQRRFQSTSTAPNTRETPFDTQSPQPTSPPKTHYEFFPKALPQGPPPAGPFDIDLSALKKEFLQLQARAHPDMHPQSDKKRAEALSSAINTAYKTLQSPLLRAQYLLSLRGIETAEDETAKVEDPELLMEVLEARELIEEAETEEDLVGLREENEGRIGESVARLGEMFQKEDWEGARGEVVRLRYWSNIKESIEGWEKGVGIVLNH